MLRIAIYLPILFLPVLIYSQPFSAEHIINTRHSAMSSICSADIDNDGDLDIVASSQNDDKVAWYENLGNGTIDTAQHIISTVANGVHWIYAFDVDNDFDVDILTAGWVSNKICWYENLGNNTFSGRQILVNNLRNASTIAMGDMDQDNDDDLVWGSHHWSQVGWNTKIGGGIDTSRHVITHESQYTLSGTKAIHTADLNGDTLIDILVASMYDNKISWFNNLGSGNFDTIPNIINGQATSAECVYTADFDNDGDLDVVSVSGSNNTNSKIQWYKNDGSGNFSAPITLTTSVDWPKSVYATDLDNDRDMDILFCTTNDGKLGFFENKGNGTFAPFQLVTQNTQRGFFIRAPDLDNDGDKDIIVAGYNPDEVVWFENQNFAKTEVSGRVFYDINLNKKHDVGEPGFDQIAVHANPSSDYTFTDDSGKYSMKLHDTLGYYTLGPGNINHWQLVTDSATYTVKVDTVLNKYAGLDFGYVPTVPIDEISIQTTPGYPRCDTTSNYWISLYNIGSKISSGYVHLKLDDSLTLTQATFPLDSVNGNSIYWSFDTLNYFSQYKYKLRVKMPDYHSIGDTLTSTVQVYVDSIGTTQLNSTKSVEQILRCGFDPNDKSVIPAGIGSNGRISPNTQTLEYKIRFQNTGNDTAFNIVIKDRLDTNLDWNTLQPLASSHPVKTKVEQTGDVEFNFNNIMLVDSGTNEPNSHGFIAYSIRLKPNRKIGTKIENTAYIYFDANPPIITNTVINTIDTMLDKGTFISPLHSIQSFKLYPNPVKNELILQSSSSDVSTNKIITCHNILGEIVLEKYISKNANITRINTSTLTNGIYIVIVKSEGNELLYKGKVVKQ